MAKEKIPLPEDENNSLPEEKTVATRGRDGIKYDISALRARSRKLFNVNTYVFDAATKDLAGEQYSIEQIKSRIEKWLKQEVRA